VNGVAKKIGPPPKPDRNVTSHVQDSPGDSAMSPELPGAPAFNTREVDSPEGMFERTDLVSAQGMGFGALDRGEAPDNRAFWTPV
jgi:hypothetical protein